MVRVHAPALVAPAALVMLAVQAACGPRESKRVETPPESLATVEQLLLAHRIAPGAPLGVRLVGTVGPDGSWALGEIEVREAPGEVLLLPHIRRVPGEFFVQMVVPLDAARVLHLPAGRTRVAVRHAGGTLADTVTVVRGAVAAAPALQLAPGEAASVGVEVVVAVRVEASAADGWVDRVEVREAGAGTVGPWRAPEFALRDGRALHAGFSVHRPAGDGERRFEARAVDGQGAATTATLVLPAR